MVLVRFQTTSRSPKSPKCRRSHSNTNCKPFQSPNGIHIIILLYTPIYYWYIIYFQYKTPSWTYVFWFYDISATTQPCFPALVSNLGGLFDTAFLPASPDDSRRLATSQATLLGAGVTIQMIDLRLWVDPRSMWSMHRWRYFFLAVCLLVITCYNWLVH